MIAVTMTDDGVLDLRWIEAQFLQSVDDLVLDRVVEDGIDDDDAVRGAHGPRRVFRLSNEVEIVKDLDRLDVPFGSRRWTLTAWSCRGGLSTRLRTDRAQQTDKVLTGRSLGRGAVSLCRISRLCERDGRAQHCDDDTSCQHGQRHRFHGSSPIKLGLEISRLCTSA